MAKLQSTFKNMFLSLFIITLVVATLLAQVNKMTAKPIAAAKALKLENAVKEVVPEFDNNPVAEAYMMATPLMRLTVGISCKKGRRAGRFCCKQLFQQRIQRKYPDHGGFRHGGEGGKLYRPFARGDAGAGIQDERLVP